MVQDNRATHPTGDFDALSNPWHGASQWGHGSVGSGTLSYAAHPPHSPGQALTAAFAELGKEKESKLAGACMKEGGEIKKKHC